MDRPLPPPPHRMHLKIRRDYLALAALLLVSLLFALGIRALSGVRSSVRQVRSSQLDVCPAVRTLLSDDEVTRIETATAWFIGNLSRSVRAVYDSNTYSSFVPPSTEGTIYDELQNPKEPGLHFANYFETFRPAIATVATCNDDRVILGSGDGAKNICRWMLPILNAPSCNIYSLGSNNDFSFENSCAQATTCSVHTFDCTIGRNQERIHERLYFYPWCIDVRDHRDGSRDFFRIGTLMTKLGHKRIDYLKMDIEAFEHDIFNSWKASDELPSILSFELHTTSPPIPKVYRRLTVGEISLEMLHLYYLGFRTVSAEKAGGGVEVTMFRLMCPTLTIHDGQW